MKPIPERFYRGFRQPKARTVGELKKLLDTLPDSLPVKPAFGDAVVLTVFNHDQHDEHLSISNSEDQ